MPGLGLLMPPPPGASPPHPGALSVNPRDSTRPDHRPSVRSAGTGRRSGDQGVSRACGRVMVPGLARAARVACSRYAFGSTPQSLADSIRL